MFRFNTALQAAQAFDAINADYESHCRAARQLAETHFDAKQVVATILNRTQAGGEVFNDRLEPRSIRAPR